MCVWVLQFYVHVREILDCFRVQYIFRHKFIVVKSACYLHVHLSIWFSVAPTAWISVKFYIEDSYENLSEEIQICLKWGKNNGHWHEDISMLLLVTWNCHKSTLLTKMVSDCSFFCLAAYIIVAPTGQIYVKFWYRGLILEKPQIWLKSGMSHEDISLP